MGSPPPETRQTHSLYTLMVTKNEFFTFPARLTLPGSRSMNEYTLKNSYHFYKDLNDFKPRAGNFMISFDVSSLYTNVPVTETLAIILERIFKDTDSSYGIDRINFSEFLKITASYCYFLFNKILYKQIDGFSMGNSIAPSLANIFLCHLETILFRKLSQFF